MGTLRNHCLTQGRRVPIANHEPFRAKQTWTVACIGHDLLAAFLRKLFVLRYYHTMGTWEPALHKHHSRSLEVPSTCTFIVTASLLLYDSQCCAASTPDAILPHRGATQCPTQSRTVRVCHVTVPPSSMLYRSAHQGFRGRHCCKAPLSYN